MPVGDARVMPEEVELLFGRSHARRGCVDAEEEGAQPLVDIDRWHPSTPLPVAEWIDLDNIVAAHVHLADARIATGTMTRPTIAVATERPTTDRGDPGE